MGFQNWKNVFLSYRFKSRREESEEVRGEKTVDRRKWKFGSEIVGNQIKAVGEFFTGLSGVGAENGIHCWCSRSSKFGGLKGIGWTMLSKWQQSRLCFFSSSFSQSPPSPFTAAPAVDFSTLIISMANCLTFVSSDSTTAKPEGSCCSGFKTVLKTDK